MDAESYGRGRSGKRRVRVTITGEYEINLANEGWNHVSSLEQALAVDREYAAGGNIEVIEWIEEGTLRVSLEWADE